MEFYRDVLGGELTLSTFGEIGGAEDPAERDKVMHTMLETEDGLVLMGLRHAERDGRHPGRRLLPGAQR